MHFVLAYNYGIVSIKGNIILLGNSVRRATYEEH